MAELTFGRVDVHHVPADPRSLLQGVDELLLASLHLADKDHMILHEILLLLLGHVRHDGLLLFQIKDLQE